VSSSTKRAAWGSAVAALAVVLVLAAGLGEASAKKKGAKAKPFQATKVLTAPIPDGVLDVRSTPLRSTIAVPKKYKGKVVGDVNVTRIQTTGSEAPAAAHLIASLIAPNGRTVVLFEGKGDQSLGPWTLDDDTPVSICNQPAAAPCLSPNQSLQQPFAGTSNLAYNDGPSLPPLQGLNGVPMRGKWTLTISDVAPGATSTLNRWGLKINPARPVGG
jgi:hypothetical protein